MSWKSATAVAILALAGSAAAEPPSSGVPAMAVFKEANTAYAAQDYRRAAELYEQAIALDPGNRSGVLGDANFYLASSYDMQWLAAKGGPDGRHLLEVAEAHYRWAVDTLRSGDARDQALRLRALHGLVGVYGLGRLNDPVKAESTLLTLIALEPDSADNYRALANVYEDAGEYEAAEHVLLVARDRCPRDPAVFTQLAGYYHRQGKFDQTMAALQQRAAIDSSNPEGFYTMATYYFDKAYRDFTLPEGEKRDAVGKGLQSVDVALGLKPDYVEALVYKTLLLRLEAGMETDPARHDELIRQADALRDRAQALRKPKG